MFTFIELQGFSKRRQLLLPDDEFRAFQELLIQDPTAGDIIAGTGSFRKIRWQEDQQIIHLSSVFNVSVG
ncbi:hypothetical protein ACUOFC_56590, partial [Escherichia sp. TWPC-MK]